MSLVSDAPPDLWPAPAATVAVRGTVRLPGSKSMTNRALLLAALADGPSLLRAPLVSRDSTLMIDALRSLGTEIDTGVGAELGTGQTWAVRQAGRLTGAVRQAGRLTGGGRIDCGLAGTVMRFVPPVAALADGQVTFDGDEGARSRPMAALLGSLRELGVLVDGDGLPFTVRAAGRVPGGATTLDASASSQFVSALLLAGARYDAGVTIRHLGPPVPSRPHLAMTVQMLRDAGVTVIDDDQDRWRVEPGTIRALDLDIEPDLSNAAPFLAAALVTGGEVLVPGWPVGTTQAGDALRGLLTALGGTVRFTADGLVVAGTGRITGTDLDLREAGELTPVLVALCALADGPSRIRGVAHLRGHETDRLAALATELGRLGADVSERPDGLVVRPRPLRGGPIGTYHDHRMAQFAAVLGLAVPGILIADVATTGKTMPDFPAVWSALVTGSRTAGSAAAGGRS
jgi:3-phosphoshikimate 1-carboxyvinyltransferase